MSSYCMKCKSKTGCVNGQKIACKNGAGMMKSECSDCGSKKCQIIPKSQQKGDGSESFASESYKGKNKRAQEVDGYKYDRASSNKNIAIYKNDQGKAIVANRGTDLSSKKKAVEDLKNDALIVLGKTNKLGHRVEKTKKAINNLQSQGYDVTATGHSLGARVTYEAVKKGNTKADLYSVGSSPADKIKKNKTTNTNITSYRNKYDPVASNAGSLGIKNDNVNSKLHANPHALDHFKQAGGGVCKF